MAILDAPSMPWWFQSGLLVHLSYVDDHNLPGHVIPDKISMVLRW